MVRLDHVVVAVRSLEEAADLVASRLGLAGHHGGRAPGLGTESFIVPLGAGSYLELIAVCEEREAGTNPLGKAVLAAVEGQAASFLTWAVQPGELQPPADRLELTPHLMKRSLPDGGDVACNIAGLQQALEEPPLPYFVEWQAPEAHPSSVDAEHSSHPMGVAWIEVAGDRQRLQAWLGDGSLPLQFVEGPPGVRGLSILTEGQPIVLREPLQLESLPPLQPEPEHVPAGAAPEAEPNSERAGDEGAAEGDAAEGPPDAAPVSCNTSVLQAVIGGMEQAVEAVEVVAGQLLTPAGQQPKP